MIMLKETAMAARAAFALVAALSMASCAAGPAASQEDEPSARSIDPREWWRGRLTQLRADEPPVPEHGSFPDEPEGVRSQAEWLAAVEDLRAAHERVTAEMSEVVDQRPDTAEAFLAEAHERVEEVAAPFDTRGPGRTRTRIGGS